MCIETGILIDLETVGENENRDWSADSVSQFEHEAGSVLTDR
jgi:hypothetical protein